MSSEVLDRLDAVLDELADLCWDAVPEADVIDAVRRLETARRRGCDAKLPWCEAHHVRDFATGGPATVSIGALACCGDHRDHEAMGWHAIMLHGIPHWVPPLWLDPEQQPRRNTVHD